MFDCLNVEEKKMVGNAILNNICADDATLVMISRVLELGNQR